MTKKIGVILYCFFVLSGSSCFADDECDPCDLFIGVNDEEFRIPLITVKDLNSGKLKAGLGKYEYYEQINGDKWKIWVGYYLSEPTTSRRSGVWLMQNNKVTYLLDASNAKVLPTSNPKKNLLLVNRHSDGHGASEGIVLSIDNREGLKIDTVFYSLGLILAVLLREEKYYVMHYDGVLTNRLSLSSIQPFDKKIVLRKERYKLLESSKILHISKDDKEGNQW
jgi:hypothetical protein